MRPAFKKVVIALLLTASILYAGALGFYTLGKYDPFLVRVGPFAVVIHIDTRWGPHLLPDWAYDAAAVVVAWIGPQQGLTDEELEERWVEL